MNGLLNAVFLFQRSRPEGDNEERDTRFFVVVEILSNCTNMQGVDRAGIHDWILKDLDSGLYPQKKCHIYGENIYQIHIGLLKDYYAIKCIIKFCQILHYHYYCILHKGCIMDHDSKAQYSCLYFLFALKERDSNLALHCKCCWHSCWPEKIIINCMTFSQARREALRRFLEEERQVHIRELNNIGLAVHQQRT